MSDSSSRHIVMTQSKADECQREYERLLHEWEANRKGEPNPMDYYTVKALWHRAYGADQVQIIPDPKPEPPAV